MTIATDPHTLDLRIEGRVANVGQFQHMEILAAAPAQRMTSYAGSALPHPNPSMAFDSANHVEIGSSGTFDVEFAYPNSYYTWDGKTKVPPTIFVRLLPKASSAEPIYVRFELEDVSPLRTLNHRAARKGPEFYDREDKIGVPPSQEWLLKNMEHIKTYFHVA